MARVARSAGLALLLAPALAWPQDATAVVAFGAPPLLLAPLITLYLRARYLMPAPGANGGLARLAAFGVAELVLWIVIAGTVALVWFAERWAVIAIAVLAVLGLVSTARLVGAPHPSWRFTAGMLLVFPVTWLLLQLAWYFVAVLAFKA
jgi:hypothetical protein